MMRLFLVILMAFVFNFNASAQIRFYRLDNIQIKQDSYEQSFFFVKGMRYAMRNWYTSSVICKSNYLISIEFRYSQPNYIYDSELKKVIITTIPNYHNDYKQVYPAKKVSSIFHKYKEGLYRKGMLLYSDDRILQPVYKKDRKLLKIKNVKLVSAYKGYSVHLSDNWTTKQFEANLNPSIDQVTHWSYANTQSEINKTIIRNYKTQSKTTISIIDVTFTSGHKVRLHIYNDPEWANAKPGMLVERFKVRQITVYKLK